MKVNKVLVLALAGLILAVMTSGTAFAASYDGTSTSYYNGASDFTQTGYSHGDLLVTQNQYLDWNIDLQNHLTRQITAQVGAFGFNRNTFNYEGFDSGSSNWQTISAGKSMGGVWQGFVRASSGSYAIIEGQSYFDGGYTHTLTFGVGGGSNTEKRFHFV